MKFGGCVSGFRMYNYTNWGDFALWFWDFFFFLRYVSLHRVLGKRFLEHKLCSHQRVCNLVTEAKDDACVLELMR